MKPIEVRFTNLRSYRGVEPTTVTFAGNRLLGVLGDTGAGKSSVIEALVASLYSATTWDGKNVSALIADGAKEMRVELDFEAAGRTWKVTRVIKAKGAAMHSLVEVGTLNRWDGAREVNDQIVKQVGLTYKQFLQSVVLPQGKFDTLLKASATDRAKALESILGMEQLRQVREQALDATNTLRPALDVVRDQRARMLDDPAGRAGELSGALEVLTVRAAALQKAAGVVAEQDATVQRQEQLERTFGAFADELGTVGLADAVTRIGELAEADLRHRQVIEPLAADVRTTKSTRDALDADVRTAQVEGRDAASIGRAQRAMEKLAVSRENLERERERIGKDEGDLEALRRDAETAAGALTGLQKAESVARAEAERLDGIAGDARAALELAGGRLRAARVTAQAVVASVKTVDDVHTRHASAVGTAAQARDRADGAAGVLQEAEAALAAAQRADAAACAAEGLGPGESCPVCAQQLPDGFTAPVAADLDAANKALTGARSKAKSAEREATRLEAERNALAEGVTIAEAALEQSRGIAASAYTDLVETLVEVDLDADDTAVLAPVTAVLTTAVENATAAKTGLETATAKRAEAEGTSRQAADAVTAGLETLDADRQRLTSQGDALDRAVADLPVVAAPALPLSAESIAVSLVRLTEAARAAEKLVSDGQDAVTDHQQAVDRLAAAERERHREVGEALPEVRVILERFSELAASAAIAAQVDPPDAGPGTAGDVDRLAAWAARLPAVAERAADACRLRAEAAHATAVLSRQARDDALRSVDCADATGLNQEIGAVNPRCADGRRDLAEATRQIPVAARLDAAVGEAAPLLEALGEVTDVLSPAKFPKWVIERRQRKLLELAADRLGEMTGDMLRFAEDFQIYDQRTGMCRDPNTLSGGEMFMASLALALTLVEMSTGTGDPQGALFLDEGFSSLDGDCLSEAMSVLDTQTAGGRVVTIITHLRAVAEYVDQVLWAEKGTTTSTLRALPAEEIERLLANDSSSGLLV